MMFGMLAMQAQQAPAKALGQGSMLGMLVPFILVFAIFYLLIIMPQRKKQKEHMQRVANLRPGDRIITTGGIFGKIVSVQETKIELKIAANTNIEIARSAVGAILGASDKPETT